VTTSIVESASNSPTNHPVSPFPALTPSERLHLEIYGYVVIENALTSEQTEALLDAVYTIEDDFHADGPIRASGQTGTPWDAPGAEHTTWDPTRRSHHYSGRCRQHFRVDNLPHLGAPFLDYVTHPRLVGMAEEAIGGEARLEQSDAHIARPPEDLDSQGYGFHRGAPRTVSYDANGLYHLPFVKTLTNLTDLGPDDGGTTVIAGTHKVDDIAIPAAIQAALDDPTASMIHTVVAPAGSTLLFFESLVHSGGIIRSGRDRPFIVAGYTPPHFQACDGYEPAHELRGQVPDQIWEFLDGTKGWLSAPRRRTLDQAVGTGAAPGPVCVLGQPA